ncbi:transmembrane protein, putative (macronuclear) [Tetrahymena thermophila SB210]|uniref:Transmembrane protein, putative n=1 Tax=Tetrahymena thermophila (strain SB210) TaxID=312017 RepID=W7X1A4_TETTS|nr:transmembrane protein, putative [Tetrahymena thermophila SB210]EWS73005.1 transmembrane protein, putative [Tetrahymena thermophila SB210]|eukprot:XP_012654459.1 transmembrane protein, putative [Tetrahymena thermophila SB210]
MDITITALQIVAKPAVFNVLIVIHLQLIAQIVIATNTLPVQNVYATKVISQTLFRINYACNVIVIVILVQIQHQAAQVVLQMLFQLITLASVKIDITLLIQNLSLIVNLAITTVQIVKILALNALAAMILMLQQIQAHNVLVNKDIIQSQLILNLHVENAIYLVRLVLALATIVVQAASVMLHLLKEYAFVIVDFIKILQQNNAYPAPSIVLLALIMQTNVQLVHKMLH